MRKSIFDPSTCFPSACVVELPRAEATADISFDSCLGGLDGWWDSLSAGFSSRECSNEGCESAAPDSGDFGMFGKDDRPLRRD